MIIEPKEYFSSLKEKIDAVDTFKYVVYNKEISVDIDDDTYRFPIVFRDEINKLYNHDREWIHENWSFTDMNGDKRDGCTYKRFKQACDKLEYHTYRFMTQWQKIEFQARLEADENKYVIVNNFVHKII